MPGLFQYRANHDPRNFAALPKAYLHIVRGWARHKVRPVAVPVFLIGSGSDCDLVLGDLGLPEVYCYLFVDERGATARWLGAGPQLLRNDEPIDSTALDDGDVLRIGDFAFKLQLNTAAAQPADVSDKQPTAIEAAEQLIDDIRAAEYVEQREEVAGLLRDICNSLYDESSSLRLYVEPDPPPTWMPENESNIESS